MSDMGLIGYTKADIDNIFNRMAEKEIDIPAYGAIELGRNDMLLRYNAATKKVHTKKALSSSNSWIFVKRI